MKRLAILAFAMSVMAVLLTGCHTSKKVTTTDTPGSPNSEVVAVDSYGYLSRRLGISIGKHDKENLELFTVAEKWLGVPYRYGGNTKKGCDCSGFVSQVYKAVYGKSLERNSAAIRDKNCSKIRRSQLRTGDLVFFETGSSRKINHVGIYLKDDKFIHASSSKGVIVSSLEEKYYIRTYVCSGRVD